MTPHFDQAVFTPSRLKRGPRRQWGHLFTLIGQLREEPQAKACTRESGGPRQAVGKDRQGPDPPQFVGGSCAALVRWGLMGRPSSDGCSLVKSVAVVEQTVNQGWLLTGDWQVSGSEQFLELGNRFLGPG